jgi:hypothetical protein
MLINTDYSAVVPDGGTIPKPHSDNQKLTPTKATPIAADEPVLSDAVTQTLDAAQHTPTEPVKADDIVDASQTEKKKLNIFESIATKLFHITPPEEQTNKKEEESVVEDNPIIKNKTIREQVQYLLQLPDEDYDDKKLTKALRSYIASAEKEYGASISTYKSHVAPSYRAHTPRTLNISGLLSKTYYVQSFPSYMESLWTRDILDFHAKWDLSFYIYPEDDSEMKSVLKRRATQIKSEINEARRKGTTLDSELELQYQDVQTIRDKLATHEERYFDMGTYLSVYDDTEDKLKESGRKFEQKIS